MDFSSQLNERQLEAVTFGDGPMLVIAGAGSGKTRVLTYRIAYLIEEFGIPPASILAVTFTNKAAGEMRERVASLLEEGMSRKVWLGTFHSICGRILRIDGKPVGVERNYSIYDREDSQRLIQDIIDELKIDKQALPVRRVMDSISVAKSRMEKPGELHDPYDIHISNALNDIYSLYQKRLQESNAVDFDDMIMLVIELFQKQPQLLERYARRFQYILVDEFQDTNRSQYQLVKQLSSVYRNLNVVGDDDQAIYAWRGADVRNILDFKRDFPDAHIVKLEQNYRSTQTILDAAWSVISNNNSRHEKRLFTREKGGVEVKVARFTDESSEALGVYDQLVHLRDRAGYRLDEIVILYRTNAQSRPLEEVLRLNNIPYKIVGGIRFYERQEVKDILAYLKLIANPKDDVSLKRIVNVPRRGIGKLRMKKLEEAASSNQLTLGEYLLSADESELKQICRGAFEFAKLFREFYELSKGKKAGEIAEAVIKETRYVEDYLYPSLTKPEERERNIVELLSGIQQYSEFNPEAGVAEYLQDVSILTDIDLYEAETNYVTLMTLHSAKGLEFDVVIIVGAEDGLLPLIRADDRDVEGKLEEERRLFYVGMTRAKRELFVTYADSRRGRLSFPSRFIGEMPASLVEQLQPAVENSTQTSSVRMGMRVYHTHFGKGTIVAVRGFAENTVVTVQFDRGFTKQLLLRFAKLAIVE